MEQTLTIPTLLTLTRLAMAPWIGLAIVDHAWGLACGLFLGAAITDALDGFFARLLRQESWLGTCLDPIADKVLILTCYGALMIASPWHMIPAWFVYLVLLKDIVLVIGALGGGMVQSALGIRPSIFGKIAMILQSVFVFWILLCSLMHWYLPGTNTMLFFLVMVTSSVAFAHYVLSAVRGLVVWFVRD